MAGPSGGTLYAQLGVPITATPEEIKAAHRRMARQWHPDRHRGDDAAKRRFQQIQEAYEVLIDAQKRHTYDLRLVHLLDVEDYLARFQELILTASGLDMQAARTQLPLASERRQLLLTAA